MFEIKNDKKVNNISFIVSSTKKSILCIGHVILPESKGKGIVLFRKEIKDESFFDSIYSLNEKGSHVLNISDEEAMRKFVEYLDAKDQF